MSKRSTRPLSPHLQIYRWQWSASYSILHRLTGLALSAGSVLLAFWLIALAADPVAFTYIHNFLASWFGTLLLLGFGWSLSFHLLNGIRHLFWDLGKGFSLETAQFSGHLVGLGSLLFSVFIFSLAF